MPGFFDFLGRMVNGQPIFDEQDNEKANAPRGPQDASVTPPQTAPVGPQSAIRKHDDSSFPIVEVKRVTTHVNGPKMQVYGWIENSWPEEIMLDKIRFLNTTRELDSFLNGRNGREFLLYDGPLLDREHFEALLDYKTQKEGDYFEAVHDVKFTYHPEDKSYTVDELRLHRPIRDIYG